MEINMSLLELTAVELAKEIKAICLRSEANSSVKKL
jgi:hypothetical protein